MSLWVLKKNSTVPFTIAIFFLTFVTYLNELVLLRFSLFRACDFRTVPSLLILGILPKFILEGC